MDPQGNATDNFGFDIDGTNVPTIYEVLKDEASITEAILNYKGIDVIPADIALLQQSVNLHKLEVNIDLKEFFNQLKKTMIILLLIAHQVWVY